MSDETFREVGLVEESNGIADAPSYTYFQDSWRRLKKKKVAMIALGALGLLVLMAIVGPYLRPFAFDQQILSSINQKPDALHWFGTDDLGRDLFVRIWYGARVSLFIACFAALINLLIGILYGGIAGYFGNNVDNVMMRAIDVLSSVPTLIWIILLMVMIGPGLKTMIITFAATGWVSMASLVRAQLLQIREMDYVMAAKALGAKPGRIIFRHLVPNCIGQITVQMTFLIPGAIFTEAFLSYIGLGLPIPLASWGTLANDGARMLMVRPYQMFFPSLMICITMLSFNLLGDGLRDAFDPRMKR